MTDDPNPTTFVERIVQDAKDDGADGFMLKRFREVATVLAPFVPESKDVKYAAFVDDDGEPSIVVQSLTTDRRLNITLPTDSLEILRIDEHMKSRTGMCGVDNHEFITEAIRWCVDGDAPEQLQEPPFYKDGLFVVLLDRQAFGLSGPPIRLFGGGPDAARSKADYDDYREIIDTVTRLAEWPRRQS